MFNFRTSVLIEDTLFLFMFNLRISVVVFVLGFYVPGECSVKGSVLTASVRFEAECFQ